MKKNSHVTLKRRFDFVHPSILFGIVLVGLIIIIGTAFASRNSRNAGQLRQQGHGSLSTSQTTRTSYTEPIDWEEHEDFERGFILKYPSSWYLEYSGRRGNLFDFFGVTTVTTYDPAPDARDWQNFRLTSNDLKILLYWAQDFRPESQSVNRWVQERASKGNMPIVSSSEIVIGDKILVQAISQDNLQDVSSNIYYIPYGERIFVVNASPANSTHQMTLETIISELQFID